jgi:hypothetical protein
VIYGIVILSKKELRDKINYSEVINFFIVFSVLKIFDCLSTAYFSYKIGPGFEANLILKFFMIHLGIWQGIILHYIIVLPMMFLWTVVLNYLPRVYESKTDLWKMSKLIIILAITIVIINNMLV